jgi:hypothetical protein
MLERKCIEVPAKRLNTATSSAENENRDSPMPKLQGGEPDSDSVLTGEEPTEEEMFYVGLADEQIKKNLPFVNEVLRQLVTLSTALIAGSVAILGITRLAISPGLAASAVVCFLVSLACALVGVLPYCTTIHRRSPEEIKESIRKATDWKLRLARISGGALFVGLLVLMLALIWATH